VPLTDAQMDQVSAGSGTPISSSGNTDSFVPRAVAGSQSNAKNSGNGGDLRGGSRVKPYSAKPVFSGSE
jgi:hypothetical protein